MIMFGIHGLGLITIRNIKHGLLAFLSILLFTGQVPISMAIEVDVSGNPYGFTGQRQFGEANDLIYLRARCYDPAIGRFINRDPIGYQGGINLYTYCGNNPINWIDPYGLKAPVWHTHRNIANRCPKKEPKDNQADNDNGCGNSNPWREDPSPFHGNRNCYRRKDKTGPGSSQCCYASGILDDTSKWMGTYDYVSPTGPLEALMHGLFDVAPHFAYGGGYEGGLTSTY